MSDLTLPQAKKMIWMMMGLCMVVIVIFVYEMNDFFGYQFYEPQYPLDYQQGFDDGRDMELGKGIHGDPCEFYSLYQSGEYDYSLTPFMQDVIDNEGWC